MRRVDLTIDDEVYGMVEREARLVGLSVSAWLTRAARREAIRSDAARLGEWAARHCALREEWAIEAEREGQARLDDALNRRDSV